MESLIFKMLIAGPCSGNETYSSSSLLKYKACPGLSFTKQPTYYYFFVFRLIIVVPLIIHHPVKACAVFLVVLVRFVVRRASYDVVI